MIKLGKKGNANEDLFLKSIFTIIRISLNLISIIIFSCLKKTI